MIDAHCHLADPRLAASVDAIIAEARQRGITRIFMAGVDPLDWLAQEALRALYPETLVSSFGLHPYWVAENTDQECDDGLAQLAQTDDGFAIGETGLDLRPQFVHSRDRQIRVFREQLKLANMLRLPVVLHSVKADGPLLEVLEDEPPKHGGFVHAFMGSAEVAARYVALGLHLSFGGRLLRPEAKKAREAAVLVPEGRILLESDAPDGAPPGLDGLNVPWTVFSVARELAELRGTTFDRICASCTNNALSLLPPTLR